MMTRTADWRLIEIKKRPWTGFRTNSRSKCLSRYEKNVVQALRLVLSAGVDPGLYPLLAGRTILRPSFCRFGQALSLCERHSVWNIPLFRLHLFTP